MKKTNIILNTFLKTAVGICLCLGFFMSVFVSLFPKTAFNLASEFGAGNVAVLGFENVYEKESSFENLYNLVKVSAKFEHDKTTEKYTLKFLEDVSPEKAEFVQKADESVLQSVTDSSYAYVASVENYFANMYVVSACKNGNVSGAKEVALQTIAGGLKSNPLCFALDSFVDVVAEQENSLNVLKAIYENKIDDKSFEQLLDEKVALIDARLDEYWSTIVASKKSKLMSVALLQTKNSVEICRLNVYKCLKLNYNEYNSSEWDAKIESLKLKIADLSNQFAGLENLL